MIWTILYIIAVTVGLVGIYTGWLDFKSYVIGCIVVALGTEVPEGQVVYATYWLGLLVLVMMIRLVYISRKLKGSLDALSRS